MLAFVSLVSLGVWQIERRAWKHALIAQVDARIHAAPAAAPGPDDWPAITPANAGYRRIAVIGTYLPGQDTFTQAVTTLGGGFWLLTPLRTDRGFTVLINRGFVEHVAPVTTPPAPVRVTGLLRITEPGGGFLRSNDATTNHWYSRDVAAIARARHIDHTAPYFIDADAASATPGGPVGGLTVVQFADNHLVYALTWFGLAAMVILGAVLFAREERRVRRGIVRNDR